MRKACEQSTHHPIMTILLLRFIQNGQLNADGGDRIGKMQAIVIFGFVFFLFALGLILNF